ncbi:Yip1 family protein [Arthrobacter sp. MDT2-2]
MSTPGTGNTDGDRRAGARRADGPDNPTELIDTGRSGSGASSAGRADSTPADGHGTGATRADGGSEYVPGAYSSEDDTSGDYVPGMYSDTPDSAPTRESTPAPISASRDASPRHEDTTPQTRVVPVTATKQSARTDGADRGRERDVPRSTTAGSGVPSLEDRKLLHRREKEHFGGMKFGSAFFGWLTATGMFVLLSALVGALAALFGVGADLSPADVRIGSGEAQTAGLTAAVVFGVILLLSYFAGGYVAGRMARFSGVKQGVAVWLWAIIVAVVLAIIGFIVGNQANITDRFQNLGVPSAQELTGPGLIGLLVVAAVALLGAILGGLAGMRYHRKIDRADFDALDAE